MRSIGIDTEFEDGLSVWALDGFDFAFALPPVLSAPTLEVSVAPTTAKSASVSPSTNPVLDDTIAHLTNGGLSYAGALAVLRDAAPATRMTSTLFADLTAVADDLADGVITATKYVKQMFENVVLGNSANAYWNGGANDEVAIGDLTATSTRAQYNKLLGKWFLGTDLPGTDSSPGFNDDDASYQTYKQPLFTSAGPKITDVSQGQVGDCWFLAALADTALLDPSLIEGMISQHGNGTYVIRFEVNGQPDYVTVNGELSTYSGGVEQYDGSQMEFANSTSSLWVPLIEKGLAQLSEQTGVLTGMEYAGGQNQYYELNAGGGEGVSLITGQSYNTYALGGESGGALTSLLGTMESTLAAGNDVMVGTSDDYVSGNLVDDHMFAVTAINSAAGTVSLYNPWGGNAFGEGKAESFTISASALVDDQAYFYAAHGKVTA